MSIKWTVMAGYLYLEVAIVIIMIMPIFRPRRWNQFFKSRIFSMFQKHTAAYFYVLLVVLSLFLIDAVREMKKYSHNAETETPAQLASEKKDSVKVFRAQRNFYITGFAIFLAFVIRRLVSMLIIQDELSKKAEKIVKQAVDTVNKAKNTISTYIQCGTERCPVAQEWEDKLTKMAKMLNDNIAKMQAMKEECDMWKLKFLEVQDLKESGLRGETEKQNGN